MNPKDYIFIDLTHTLTPETVTFTGGCGFDHKLKLDYSACTSKIKFRVQKVSMHAGIGTHIDAPLHCIEGGACSAQLPITSLINNAIKIDVSQMAHERFSISVEDIEAFEKTHGTIEKDTFVIFYTGWDRFFSNPKNYRNHHLFPSVGLDAAKLLMKRQIAGIGIDTLSPDRPEDDFFVHELLLGNDKTIIENIANASSLPVKGFTIFALPIPMKDVSEAPIRLIAAIKK